MVNRFRRYGAKGGSLATGQGLTVLTRTIYVETQSAMPGTDRGTRAVVTIHLRGGGDILPDLRMPVARFAEALVEDPDFALELFSRIPEDVPLPDLIARIERLTIRSGSAGERLILRVALQNIGTQATDAETSVALFLSDDNVLDDGDEFLGSIPIGNLDAGGGHTAVFRSSRLSSIDGRFLLVVVDPTDSVAERDEPNNFQWERIRIPVVEAGAEEVARVEPTALARLDETE